jgi:hypothetical protein
VAHDRQVVDVHLHQSRRLERPLQSLVVELLSEAAEQCVHRIPDGVEDDGLWEEEVDEANVAVVEEHLVYDSQNLSFRRIFIHLLRHGDHLGGDGLCIFRHSLLDILAAPRGSSHHVVFHFRQLAVEDAVLTEPEDIGMSIEDSLQKG